jgi:hypothetical protein
MYSQNGKKLLVLNNFKFPLHKKDICIITWFIYTPYSN